MGSMKTLPRVICSFDRPARVQPKNVGQIHSFGNKNSASLHRSARNKQSPNVSLVLARGSSDGTQELVIAADDELNKKMGLADYLTDLGGPRFFSPLPQILAEESTAQDLLPMQRRPFMLFLPGIDGTGVNALRQFGFLAPRFELRSMNIPRTDRTPFKQLVEEVVEFIEQECADIPSTRPVYLLGESFGGILALAVALRCPQVVHRVVLVNPATSFERSIWTRVGPLLPQLPDDVYQEILPLAVSPLVSNPMNMAADAVDTEASPLEQLSQLGDTMLAMTPALQKLADILPKETLAWKLKLLKQGCEQVVPSLNKVQQRVLVVAGSQDLLIPSQEEAKILTQKIPRCSMTVIDGSSHAMLMEKTVNLMQIIQDEGFYTTELKLTSYPIKRSARKGVAGPMEIPTQSEVAKSTEGQLDVFSKMASPVFLSTRASDGKPVLGLEGFPRGRPVLIVGNHQTFAPDLSLLIKGMLQETGILVRGLAHPFVFLQGAQREKERDPNSPPPTPSVGSAGVMSQYGAVPVSPRNMYRLLDNGEVVLLYPGGVREAFKNKGEEYQLIWPRRPEVIRMAARFGATIVPLSAVGADDVELLFDSKELLKLPFIGDRLRDFSRTVPSPRKGASEAKEVGQDFIMPVPNLLNGKPPNRFYFLFGKPIITSPDDTKDPELVESMYKDLKFRVESGLEYLLTKRKQDPYGDFLKRSFYEASWGGKKQAPTFDP